MGVFIVDIAKALEYGWPTAQWSCGEDYASLDWRSLDIPKPDEKAVTLIWNAYLVNKALIQYKEDRRKEYPSLKDQLDMQYWDKINSTTVWEDTITAVKDAHPKPKGLD